MEVFTSPPRSTRFLPLLLSFFIVIVGLSLVLIAAALIGGREPCSLTSGTDGSPISRTATPERFALITVGMPESHVLDLLGLPSEAKGPQFDPIYVPSVLNPQDCTGKIPCQCEGPVKEFFYYRGTLGESFYVYLDCAGVVCCHQRTHSMRMDISSSF